MSIVKINKQNYLTVLKHDNGTPFVMTITELKHYHNYIKISSHFIMNDNGDFDSIGELLSVLKFNRKNDLVKNLIISA